MPTIALDVCIRKRYLKQASVKDKNKTYFVKLYLDIG